MGAGVLPRRGRTVAVEQDLSPEDRLDVACDGMRLALTLDDFYEDTDLLRI